MHVQTGQTARGREPKLRRARREPGLPARIDLVVAHVGRVADEQRAARNGAQARGAVISEQDRAARGQPRRGEVRARHERGQRVQLDTKQPGARKARAGRHQEAARAGTCVDHALRVGDCARPSEHGRDDRGRSVGGPARAPRGSAAQLAERVPEQVLSDADGSPGAAHEIDRHVDRGARQHVFGFGPTFDTARAERQRQTRQFRFVAHALHKADGTSRAAGAGLARSAPWSRATPVVASAMLAAALALAIHAGAPGPETFDAAAAGRFAGLALACVHKEYPNKLAHVLQSDADVRPPRALTPAFYGCYDWHSAVHGHWLLARLLRSFPAAPFAGEARAALRRSLTPPNLEAERRYLEDPGRASFERPYGLAWLLQLAAELREWDAPEARAWSQALLPLEEAAARRLFDWLPKLTHPVRVGEHSQTAFALGLVLDWARGRGDRERAALIEARARAFYLGDRDCPLNYEPSGEDFLSPCLGEADLMRRVLPPAAFARWLFGFMPRMPRDGRGDWLAPGVVSDPSDPKLAHLDGLNLSRAWMLEGIASGLPPRDTRIAGLRAAARAHAAAGLGRVTGEHYEGGHWLGSFAAYLLTRRGLTAPGR